MGQPRSWRARGSKPRDRPRRAGRVSAIVLILYRRYYCPRAMFRLLQAIAVVAAFITLAGAAGALGAPSRVATPISCGRASGAPWTVVVKAPETLRRGSTYYVYETANLSCADVAKRVDRLSRLTPEALRRLSILVSGQRLQCLTAVLPREIKSAGRGAGESVAPSSFGRFAVRA
jgi:hypothetical protein